VCFFRPQEMIKGTSANAPRESGNEKLNSFRENRVVFFFSGFYTIFTSPNFVGHVTLNF
jgi:hypothetical protein